MFSTTDTIVAIATPPGRGGLGVVRLSGPDSPHIARELTVRSTPFEPRHATFCRLACGSGILDHAVITSFPAPHSYTGDDVVEISVHGSPVIAQGIVSEAMRRGARLAAPGEFTLRAFLNGRIDLVQAEAVRDLVDAVTPLQARAAFDQLEGTLTEAIRRIDTPLFELCARLEASLDFPEEGYHFVAEASAADQIGEAIRAIDDLLGSASRGRLIREGVQVVIAGRINSGKSSIFNNLSGVNRAIVADLPGTTRDLLTERVDLDGVPVTLVDTAGVHDSPSDAVEAEGIARAAAARSVAAVTLLVLDGSQPLTDADRALVLETEGVPRLVVANKSDLQPAWPLEAVCPEAFRISALHGSGFDNLRRRILETIAGADSTRDLPAVTNIRHVNLLTQARDALDRGRASAASGAPEEFVSADLNEARALLEEVTGSRTTDDLLGHIFSSFCIGK